MTFALYERVDNVGIITLNRPDRLNAISGAVLADFETALSEGLGDSLTSVLIVTGAGRAFCSGDDLQEYEAQAESEAAAKRHIQAIQQITRLLLGSEKPVIGAVHGYAVGGGFEWVLNCDIVVASEDLVAFFPEMDWGNFVTGGVTHLLPMTIGYQRTMELLILGEKQSAHRLNDLGIVNFVVPRDQMMQKAMEIARRIGEKSRTSIGRLKSMINQDLGIGLWRALDLEEAATVHAFLQPESADRVKRFTNRKSPKK
ncbi:enoyl-CoA hydratase/isomerase family protein [Noviherbaspirillum saxi]|uniref:Enoyl-CoA hydratase/isomerase family protein n=1 Tax=Noviherbaspirillum saxi TaxID=2320863 RepID=A0A3A3FGX8_9BURK|nr:enoyl-CoA hydratase/isomerase family protein [Noviherbaspirillum saxi]RJF92397.1 enoyl-CoA hydratase/isomerase family protein [Noviherbaspirillum saxi]